METAYSFGYWIRRQRKALDLTQQALAEQVGCSLAAIKKIEQDERRPSRQIAGLLAEVLGVPASQREIFLEVARGVRPVDQLVSAQERVTSALPTGIVTFLFTDIEDSTKLAQEYAENWEILRARHHAMLREAIESNNGYIFQIAGDGFCAAFYTPKDGLRAAIEAQRKLQMENWYKGPLKARMGVHTGEAELHGNEYHGYFTLSLVERLMSAGHGGQILLSHATENLLRGHLPKDVSLLDLGEHSFKNVLQLIRVFQVITPDLQKEFPGLRAQAVFQNNLPIQLTSFIGREKEIVEVIRLLEKTRLVTLTGPGGTGKTRLAIQVANQLLDQYPDGVRMVELAPIFDPTLIPRTTAVAIGLRDEPQRPVIDMLCDYLREKKMLLLLDNCEHLIEVCAQMVDTLLRACPKIHILATSREALGIAGEILYFVPSLTRPDIRNLPSLESLNQYESIQLFMDRATSMIPTFTLTDENASAIAQICQRLDGIPLAIELAAGKIRVLSVQQIAQHLDNRFQLLTSGSRTALPRHQTLQAAIDWSYNLLSPAEQTLLRRLSVFVDGWTLEAAESICSDISVNKDDVLGLLEHLINKSIIILEDARYHMLETIRQYANEKLVEFGESNWLRDRHLEYFFNLVQTAAPHLLRPEQLDWLPLLDADYQNLRHVLEWSLSQETAEVALKLCNALWWFWKIRSYWLEGLNWTRRALATPSKTESRNEKAARARALATQAGLEWQLSNFEQILSPAQASLALALEVSDRREIAIAKFYVGTALRNKDGHLASVMHQQSFAEFEALNDEFWQAFSFPSLVEFPEKAKQKPYEWFVRCLELAREAGERYVLADVLWSYAFWLFGNNRLAEARAYAEESDRLLKEIDSENTSLNSAVFAEIAWLEGDTQKSRTLFMELNERLGLLGDKVYRRSYLTALGLLAMEEGDLHQAQLYFELALHMSREMGHKGFLAESLIELSNLYYFQGKLDTFKQNFRKSLSLKNYFSEYDKAYVLTVTLGFLYLQKPENSALLLGVLTPPEREYNLLFSQIRKRTLGRAETYARKNLGDAAFESAFAEGQKMSLDEALDLALKTVDEM